jgi:phage terminase large subunit GpA-like protein
VVETIHGEVIRQVASWLSLCLQRQAPPLHLIDWSRQVNITEGDFPGPFIPERHAPQYYLMKAIGDGLLGKSRFRHFVGKKPTQDGGTLTGHVLPQIYTAAILRDPVCTGHPDMALAGKHWRSKFRPIIRDHAPDWLPLTGQGSEDSSRVDEILLNGVSVYWIGGGASNEAGQAMITARLLTRDEIDSMVPYVYRLMGRRNDNYRKRDRDITIDISTVKLDSGSLIESALTKSTDAHVAFACPYCGRFVRWDWEQHVDFDDSSELSAKETVRLVCPFKDCLADIIEHEREKMLALENSRLVMRGQAIDEQNQVTGEPPQSSSWGITWSALDSPMISLASLASEYWKADEDLKTGDPTAMQSFYRDRLSKIWKDTNKPTELTAKHLHAISESSPYNPGEIPAWSDFLSCGCDVQLRWIYWWVESFDRNLRATLVAAGTETITRLDGGEIPSDQIPTRDERRAAMMRIDRLLDNGFELAGDPSQRQSVLLRTTDVGYLQDDMRYFLHDHPHWNAVKGIGDDDTDQKVSRSEGTKLDGKRSWFEPRLQMDEYGQWTLWLVVGDLVKNYIQNGYLLSPGPRSRHLPAGLKAHSAVIRHIISERPTEFRGRRVFKKITTNAANHFLDCAVYAAAMARAHIAVAYPEQPPPPDTSQNQKRPELPQAETGRSITLSRRHSRLSRRG